MADLVAQKSHISTDVTPDDLKYCYVSFFFENLDASKDYMPLKIRVFPHRNDVVLRIWEAGSCPFEFFVLNPDLDFPARRCLNLEVAVVRRGLRLWRAANLEKYISQTTTPTRAYLIWNTICSYSINGIHIIVNCSGTQTNSAFTLLYVVLVSFCLLLSQKIFLEWEGFLINYASKKNVVDDKVDSK